MIENLSLIVENLVIISLIDKNLEKKELTLLQELLNRPEWFFEFAFSEESLKNLIKEKILSLQTLSVNELSTMFQTNTQTLLADLDMPLQEKYLQLINSFTAELKLSSEELTLLQIQKLHLQNPMSKLNISRFEEYVEALMIYALVDESGKIMPQSEAIFILNEILIYVKGDLTLAKKEFFRIQKKAIENTEKNMSLRFNGILVENFLKLSDAQDTYLKNTLLKLATLDEKRSLQERTFDGILKQAFNKAKILGS